MKLFNAGPESRDKPRPGADKMFFFSIIIISIPGQSLFAFPTVDPRHFKLPLYCIDPDGPNFSGLVTSCISLLSPPCPRMAFFRGPHKPSYLSVSPNCLCPFPPSIPSRDSRGPEVDCFSSAPVCLPAFRHSRYFPEPLLVMKGAPIVTAHAMVQLSHVCTAVRNNVRGVPYLET